MLLAMPSVSTDLECAEAITVPLTGVTEAGEADKEALGDFSLAAYRYSDAILYCSVQ